MLCNIIQLFLLQPPILFHRRLRHLRFPPRDSRTPSGTVTTPQSIRAVITPQQSLDLAACLHCAALNGSLGGVEEGE
eukprot:scaffold131888_cov37-Tisochrysis_lutea.AAC.1